MSKVEDELAIRSLAAAYTDAVNRGDGAGMAAAYAPDGALDVPSVGARVVGSEKLEKAFTRLVERDREFLVQLIHSGIVEIDGDRATARWWFSEIKKPTGAAIEMNLGIFDDQIVRTPQGWRFAKRVAHALLRSELPSGTSFNAPPTLLPVTGLPRA